jgi:PAS domain S-box-containing protein
MRQSTRLLLAITSLLLMISGITSWYLGRGIEQRIHGVVSTQQLALAAQTAAELDRMVQDRQRIISSIGRDMARVRQNGHAPDLSVLGRNSLMSAHFPLGVYLTDPHGNIQFQNSEQPTLAAEAPFRAAIAATLTSGRGHLSPPYLPEARTLSDVPRIVFAYPIKDAEGKIIHVLAGLISTLASDFIGVIRQLKVGDSGYAYLFTAERFLMVHRDSERLVKQDIGPGANAMIDRAIGGFEGADTAVNSRGVPMLVGVKRMESTGWFLAINYPLAEAYAPAAAVRDYVLAVMLAAALLTIAIVGYLLRKSTKPLLDLTEQISTSAGTSADLVHVQLPPLPLASTAGALAHAYNRLIDRVHGEQAQQLEARRQLEEKEAFLRLVTDTLGEGVYVRNAQGAITFVNHQASQMLGYAAQEMIGQDSHALFHSHYPDGRVYPRSACAADVAAASGKPHVLEDFFWCRDGRLMQVSLNIAPILKGDRLTGSVISFRDITEQQRIKKALKDSEERQNRIIELTSDWVWEVDARGVYTYASERVVDLLGYTPREIIGKSQFALMPEPEAKRLRQPFIDIGAGQQAFAFLERISLHKQGHEVALETSGTPMFDEDGLYKGYRGIDRNISERKRAEQALIAARDEADASARVKSEFLANMSHEIRTPMNGIMGMTELVLATKLKPEQREHLELVYASAESLLTVINDILDFSKIEAGKLELELTSFNLRHMLSDALRPLALRATQKGLELTLQLDDHIPRDLVGDPARLRQVILNLVSNAIKFTATGSVSIRLVLEQASATTALLRFAVSDTGIGIPAHKHSAIFEAFVQSDSAINRTYGGTGLGLSICKTLVQLMDGRIWVESEEGKGSTFYFDARLNRKSTLLATVEPDHTVSLLPSTNAALTILLAEDNPVNQQFAISILSRAGHRVTLARNGQEAVDLALALTFDIILMDIQMPVMDGFTATLLMRKEGVTTPVVALTAHAMKGFQEQCLACGMNDYLAKPVQGSALLNKVHELCGAHPIPPIQALAPVTPSGVIIDIDEALRLTDGDFDMLRTMAGMVAAQVEEDLPTLRQCMARQDGAQLAQAAHRLKGSLATVGARAAHAACLELEELAKQHNSPLYAAGMAQLEWELARVHPELHLLALQQ